jgi:hypothetical protein
MFVRSEVQRIPWQSRPFATGILLFDDLLDAGRSVGRMLVDDQSDVPTDVTEYSLMLHDSRRHAAAAAPWNSAWIRA